MRMWKWLLTLVLVVGLLPAFGADEEYTYVGAKKCKICHSTDKKAGTHYKVWQEKKHAKAFETLLSDEAKKSAKEHHGIDDPSKAKECLSCHVIADSPKIEEGVSCEACHGPASGYLKVHAKKGYEAGVAKGLVALRTMSQEEKEAVCMKCHKEDPMNDFYKPFDYEKFWKEIDHSSATSPKVLEKRKKE